MTNDDDERERAAKRQKRNADLFTNAKNELEKLENEHLEALEVIDEANAHLTSRCRQVHLKAEGLSSTDRREFERHIKRLEEAEKRVSDIERIDLTSLTTRKKNKMDASECPTKKKKAQPLVVCTPKLTTKGAKCMAILCKTGKPCTFQAEDGFLTCRYPWHRAQEEELKKKAIPRVDSPFHVLTATNDQSPTTKPSVAQGARFNPSILRRIEPRPFPPSTEADRFGRNQDDLMEELRQSQPQQRDPRVSDARWCQRSIDPPRWERHDEMINFIDFNFIDVAERNVAERKAEEEAKAKRKAEEEAEAKRKVEEEAEAKRKAEEEAKANRKAEEEAEAERKAEEEAEAERKAKEEEAKRKAAAGAERKAKEEEAKRRAEEEAKAERKAEAVKRKAEAERKAEAKRKAEEEDTETEDEEDDYSGPDGLINAIEDGKTKIAIDLIRNSNVDVNYANQSGWTALHAISTYGDHDDDTDTEAFKALLDKNPNVNAQDAKGWTPLHCAVHWKHAEAVKILLRAGADPFAKNKEGDTPLETICRYEHSSLKCITDALKEAEKENKGKPSIRPRRECTRTRDRAKTSTSTKSESTDADAMRGARDLTSLKNVSSSNMKQIMENYDKTDDNRLEELCKKLRDKVIPKTIEEFIKFHKFTLPVSVVKGRFEEYKITCQKPYSGDMSGAIAARLKKLEHDARVYKADAELFGPR